MERQRRLQELKKQMQQKVVVKPEEKDSQLKSLLQGDCPSDAFYLGSDQIGMIPSLYHITCIFCF